MENKQNEELEEVRWGGILNEFLWTCAGVNRKILRQCPTDYAKYAGIGGTILFTALMAMLSGGYAFYTVFDNQVIAVVFGVFWGLLIFNLDRFIVNTMYSDGKVTISWREFASGLPRIIMAIFLGIVISTPLELKIFEDEINVTIRELAQSKIEEYKSTDLQRIDSLSKKKEELQNSAVSIYDANILTGNELINRLFIELRNKRAELSKENDIISALSRQIASLDTNDSIQYKRLVNERYSHDQKRNGINGDITRINASLASNDEEMRILQEKATSARENDLNRLQSEIDEVKKRLDGNTSEYVKLIDSEFGGFQARMLAFNKMKEEHESTHITSLFIMLLFIIIETTPTFFKMMIASGPYDDLLRSEMHKARVMSDKRISDINDEINTEVKISTERNKNKLEAEVAANKELLSQIALAQSELLSTAIEEWRKAELEKVLKKPEDYVKTSAVNNSN